MFSDQLETKPLIPKAEVAVGEKAKETPAPEKDRLLKGVMRVGMLSKGLLLKDDTEVSRAVTDNVH